MGRLKMLFGSKKMLYCCVIFLLLSIVSVDGIDPCVQPLGMENGLISDSQIKTTQSNDANAVRLNSKDSCNSKMKSIQIDLKRLMTITGLLFTSDTQTNATIKYGIGRQDLDDSNCDNYNKLKVSSYNNPGSQRIFKISTNISTHFTFLNKDKFTLRCLKLEFTNPACVKMEIYGCPEICSSIIQASQPLPSSMQGTSLKIHYSVPITLSGLFLTSRSMLDNITVKCLKQHQIIESKNIEISTSSLQNITIWFHNDFICNDVEVLSTKTIKLSDVSLLGCKSELEFREISNHGPEPLYPQQVCMEKLFMKTTEILTAPPHLKGSIYAPSQSLLNNMKGSWVAATNGRNEWIQACFPNPVHVSAMAIQAQGRWSWRRIKSFSLSFGYNSSYVGFNYPHNDTSPERFDGPDSRYGTKVIPLKTPISARCFRMRDLDCKLEDPGAKYCVARWELLGCMTGLKPEVKIIPATLTVLKNTATTTTCIIFGQPDTEYQILWNNQSIYNNSSYYYITTDAQKLTDLNISYTINLTILYANSSFIFSQSDENCAVAAGNETVNCYVSYACVANYPNDEKEIKQTTLTFNGYGAVKDPNVNLTNLSNTTVDVSWNSASSAGDFPVAYNISLTDNVNGTILFNESVPKKTNRGFNKLLPFRNYTFKLTAFNQFGISSKTVKKVFTTKEGVPTAIRNLTSFNISTNQIELKWKQPEIANGIFSLYFIEYGDSVNVMSINTLNTSETYVSINKLKAYTNYSIKVRPSTKNGEILGPWVTKFFQTNEAKSTSPQNIGTMNVTSSKFTVKWNQPKELNGILKTYKIEINGSKDYYPSFSDNKMYNTTGTSLVVENVYGGTNYTIHVRAINGAGDGDIGETKVETSFGKPCKANITLLQINNTQQQQVVLHPVQPSTGPIQFYELSVKKNDSKDCFKNSLFNDTLLFDSLQSIITITINKGVKNVQFGAKVFQLELIGSYLFCLRAVVNKSLIGDPGQVTIERKDLGIPNQVQCGTSTIDTNIPKGPKTTKYYVVIVIPPNNVPLELKDVRRFDENNPTRPYITGVFGEHREQFIIGDGKEYSVVKGLNQNIWNVKLKPKTQYHLLIRAYEDESKYASSPWISVKTSGISTKHLPASQNIVIITVPMVVVLILLFAVAALLVVRRKRQQSQKDKKLEVKFSDVGASNPIVEFQEDSESSNNETPLINKVPPNVIVLDPMHSPVKLADLPKYLENLHKSKVLKEEYRTLNSGQLYEWSDAILPELKSKNRYGNIVTYNHSRVKLKRLSSNGSNYVNASFIHGYSVNNMYIASQGPNVACLEDFWQVIWEQDISVVVMLTNLIENTKKKCEQYWPDQNENVTFGRFEVTSINVETFCDFVVRTFSVKQVGGQNTHTVQQYHFLSWPDHGVPKFPSDLLNFHHRVRKDHPIETLQSPMLVHCSAGVGRTGTFICIDNMLKLASEKNIVDVFNYVNYMRSRRIHMVQSEDQYMFIYDSLVEAILCGITSIDPSKFLQEYQQLLLIDPMNKKNGFQLQFDRLNLLTNSLAVEETSTGRKLENMSKNRCEVFPSNITRVVLTPRNDQYNDDYINAIYVNGYKKKDGFIATQHPLAETVYDFWKMVLEKKVATILMLNSLVENSKKFERFWPSIDDGHCYYGDIVVRNGSENIDGRITTISLLVSSSYEKEGTLNTCIISYNQWPENGVTQHPMDLIQLCTSVERLQAQHSKQPVIVMCSNGTDRSGTFIAINILLDQLKMEQTVDVFQTIKKIRAIRPEFVANAHQYQLCYNTLKTYLDSFSTYANF